MSIVNPAYHGYPNVFGLLIIGLLIIGAIDCIVGTTRQCPGIVSQHVYNPPYTTTRCAYSQTRKRQECHTTYHPAKYILLINCQNPDHVASLQVSPIAYARYENQSPVTVGERCGRWSHIVWINWIVNPKQTDY